jgi:serine phosphatase RsbU (regulator of sigma subunit)/ligand-binding sensor domain-containing protein
MRLRQLTLVLVFISSVAQAQIGARLGSLNVKNYLPKTYGANAQIFDICQDHRGIIFFANQRGVVEYDGVNWHTIKVGNDIEVNSVETDTRGRVWVGAINELGYLATGDDSRLKFVSIREKLPQDVGDFGKIKAVLVNRAGKVFFQSEKYILIYDGSAFQVLKAEGKDEEFHLSFIVDDKFYVRISNSGLHVLSENGRDLKMTSNGVVFSNKSLFYMSRFNGQLLGITDKDGIFSFNPAMEASEMNVLDGINVYSGLKIDDDYLVIGTFSEGVVVLDKQYQPLYHIDINSGMADGKVNCLFVDREKNLWVGTNKGISKIEIMSPVSIFGANNGIQSGIEDVTTYRGVIYMAAQDGVYFLDPEESSAMKAKKIPGLNVDCYGLLTFETETDTILLIAAVDGINAFQPGKPTKTRAIGEPYRMMRSAKDPNRVMICNVNGMSSIYWSGRDFVNEGYLPVVREDIFNMALQQDGTLWLGSMSNGVFKTTEDLFTDTTTAVEHFSTENGLPEGPVYIGLWNSQPYFATDAGVYQLKGKRFTLYNDFGVDFSKQKMSVHRLNIDNTDKVWMVLIDEMNNYDIGFSQRDENGKYTWRNREFSRFNDEIVHAVHHGIGGITWLGGLKGLLRYDNARKTNYDQPFLVHIRQVAQGPDVIFSGTYTGEDEIPGMVQGSDLSPELDYSGGRNLVFRFAAATFVDESKTEYSYMLEGQDGDWSEWSSSTQAIYTNVSEGTYTFRVKARNVYGQESDVASFTVKILPPWYRTVWAYAGYVLVLMLLVYGTIVFSTRRVKRQKEHLEGVVRERTAEVVAQKEEIEMQKELVEEKNKDIMDSIKYAKRIQNAILPHDDIMRRSFRDALVLFKPKDIVSGDFYWMKQKGNKSLFAAVDCTGHGVPGAFVSIIGNNGLNRAVNEYGLNEPAAILDRLTQVVEEAFAQEGGSDVKDGMDIALCALDRDSLTLEYAGANNPLYIIRNGELTEIKADKQPIGQFDGRKPFTNHVIPVQKDDFIVVFSDGYADQFGGPEGKKFKYSTLKKLLVDLSGKPMTDIRRELLATFDDWKGDHEQIDDVCIFGVRV